MALFFDQLAEYVTFEMVDVLSLGTIFQKIPILTANKIVKEQMIQTTSKKIVKPSENREEGVKEFYFEINYMRFKIQHIQPLI